LPYGGYRRWTIQKISVQEIPAGHMAASTKSFEIRGGFEAEKKLL